jgi:hypothetical protein
VVESGGATRTLVKVVPAELGLARFLRLCWRELDYVRVLNHAPRPSHAHFVPTADAKGAVSVRQKPACVRNREDEYLSLFKV